MIRSLTDSSIEVEVFISDESPYFSHYVCKILLATDVVCKSYMSENVESSEIVVTTFTTFSLVTFEIKISWTSDFIGVMRKIGAFKISNPISI